MDAPLYDDTYKGPRWTYGMTHRPPHFSHLPKGWIIFSIRPHPKFPDFGVIDFPRELTAHEVETFELTPVTEVV
jgi:hypothetical protein